MIKSWKICIVVLIFGLMINLALAFKQGLARPMTSDAQFYLMIAQSLADGHGYYLREGFWPDVPTMTRSPAWPFTVSLALRAFRGVAPDVVMRILALTLNSLVAGLVAVLTVRVLSWNSGKTNIFSWRLMGGIAGIIYILHPQALYLAYGGGSEILFLVLALGGTVLLLREVPVVHSANHHFFLFVGFLFLGLSSLARPNFLLWIGFLSVILIGRRLVSQKHDFDKVTGVRTGSVVGKRHFFLVILLAVIFLLPSFLWSVRNYRICGHFPVLSTLRGQTFYGGNNGIVANDRAQWGYWVFPNVIPGETPMVELSKRMSEYEVDAYYNKKGNAYIQAHLMEMPRLWIGKLIRAYWPLPWKLSVGGCMVGAFRGILYLAALFGLVTGWPRLSKPYLIILAAMVMVNLVTVVVFWGCSRFAFAVDPFLIPLVVLSLILVREGFTGEDAADGKSVEQSTLS